MKWLFGWLTVCLFSQQILVAQDPLTMLRSQSDVVALGEFTSEPIGEMDEQGVVGYQAEFKILQLLKGESLGERKPGGTIVVNMTRFEFEPGDLHPLLKQGGRAILFLNCHDAQSPVSYEIFDKWLGIQPAFPTLAKTLAAMTDRKTAKRDVNVEHLSENGLSQYDKLNPIQVAWEFLGANDVGTKDHDLDRATVVRYATGQPTEYDWLVTFPNRAIGDPILVAVTYAKRCWRLDPETLERFDQESSPVLEEVKLIEPVKVDLAGEWRIFLPAGYERKISLQANDNQSYTLQPSSYTFSGNYNIEGDRLVSEELDDTYKGQFAWKIMSPYLLTMVNQHVGIGSDYSGAIMFRPCPTAILEQSRATELEEKTSDRQRSGQKGVPQITVEELSKAIRREGFQWSFIGREIEFISSQREGSRVHIDGMEREILDTAVLHLSAGSDEQLTNLGPRIRVRALIVDQWYGVWQMWPYSMSNVQSGPQRPQTKTAPDED